MTIGNSAVKSARGGMVRYAAATPLALTLMLAAAPAQAQDDDGLYWMNQLDKISVVATRTPVKVEDAPATVTVITSRQIADQMVTDIKDLVRFEPGVSVRRAPSRFGAALGATGRAGNEDFNIRGIGGNRVLIQVDGIRVPQGFSFGAQDAGRGGYADVGLVKSVEILRGPASALYGSDGLSGAVSFTTSDPVDLIKPGAGFGGFVRAQYSSDDNEFAETGAIAARSGDLSAMLAYTRRDFQELDNKGDVGGSGDSRTKPNPQDGKSNAVLGKLVWDNGVHKLRLTGEYLKSWVFTDVLTGQGPYFAFGPAPSWIVDDLTARDTVKRKRFSLDWTWASAGGAIDYAHAAIYWQDGDDVQFADEDRSPVSATPRPDRERLNTFENRVYGAAVEARSDFATGPLTHRLAFGGDISWTRQKGLRDGVEPPAGETFPTRAFPETDFRLGGLFLGDEIALAGGALTIYPALRYDFYRLDPKNDPLLPGFVSAGQSDSHLSPKLGVVAKLNGGVRLFANYARGFRAPTPSQVNNFFENLAFGYKSAPNPDLKPETSESWEGGIRLTSNAVGLSITAFHADYDDFIDQTVVSGSFTPSDPAVYQFVNLDSVTVKGVEAKADYRDASGVTARMAIAYAKGTVDMASGGKQPLASVDPLSLVMGLGYADPSGHFGGELIMTHNASKEFSRTVGACSGDCYRPGAFTILDVTMFVRVAEGITLRAGVFNLLDEKYAYWSDVRGLSATSTITDAYTRPGRNASASISYRF